MTRFWVRIIVWSTLHEPTQISRLSRGSVFESPVYQVHGEHQSESPITKFGWHEGIIAATHNHIQRAREINTHITHSHMYPHTHATRAYTHVHPHTYIYTSIYIHKHYIYISTHAYTFPHTHKHSWIHIIMHTNSQTHASTQFYTPKHYCTPTYTDSIHTHIIPHIHSIHKITYIIKHMGGERKKRKKTWNREESSTTGSVHELWQMGFGYGWSRTCCRGEEGLDKGRSRAKGMVESSGDQVRWGIWAWPIGGLLSTCGGYRGDVAGGVGE